MEWRDVGIVLAVRPHGEGGAVVSLLTASHGRHAGLAPGGRGRSQKATFEPGTIVSCHWSARLEEHLGRFRCEAVESSASSLLSDPLRLAGLSAFCALSDWALPERTPCPQLYDGALAFLVALQGEWWASAYVQWEGLLLAELGVPLDLSCCAVSGEDEELAWVSPKTGRAVSRQAGQPYADRLLELPAFLRPNMPLEEPPSPHELRAGFRLTGYFLQHHAQAAVGKPIPWARSHLLQRLQAATAQNVDP